MQELAIRLALLLAIFASVFLISQLVLGAAWRNRARVAAVNTRLRMIREGAGRAEIVARLRKNAPNEFPNLPLWLGTRLRSMQRTLFASAVPLTMSQMLLLMGGLFLLVLILSLLIVSGAGFYLSSGTVVLLAVLSACAGIVLPMSVISFMAQRRRKRIEEQFPVSLDIFVRALRSGHPIAAAIELLTREMDDPIGSEFGLIADEVSYGAELTDALEAMAERWDLDDIRMFVVSLSVQSETGGNLAEILQNLSEVIRARAAMYMKVRALSAEGRMTGWMLTVLPVLAFLGMFSVNPGFYLAVARDPIFIVGFTGLILLYALGVFMIRHMIDLKV